MEPAWVPEIIRTIIDQVPVLGLRGAFTYIGASRYSTPKRPSDGPEGPLRVQTERRDRPEVGREPR